LKHLDFCNATQRFAVYSLQKQQNGMSADS